MDCITKSPKCEVIRGGAGLPRREARHGGGGLEGECRGCCRQTPCVRAQDPLFTLTRPLPGAKVSPNEKFTSELFSSHPFLRLSQWGPKLRRVSAANACVTRWPTYLWQKGITHFQNDTFFYKTKHEGNIHLNWFRSVGISRKKNNKIRQSIISDLRPKGINNQFEVLHLIKMENIFVSDSYVLIISPGTTDQLSIFKAVSLLMQKCTK